VSILFLPFVLMAILLTKITRRKEFLRNSIAQSDLSKIRLKRADLKVRMFSRIMNQVLISLEIDFPTY
jgi:hypothetical protein